MPGIAELDRIYTERGEWFIANLLNGWVTISEKLAGSAFSACYTKEGWIFYKRNTSAPISKIERTLMSYYESAIRFFEGIPEITVKRITPGTCFCCEYFPNNSPSGIEYDSLPSSGLVLTHIKELDQEGKTVRIVDDLDTLRRWAAILEVGPPPILFQGRLSDEQKDEILTYIGTHRNDLVGSFKTESLSRFIIGTLTPGSTRSYLQSTVDKPIEGIVFTFGKRGEKGYQVAQIIDPIFKELQEKIPHDPTSYAEAGDMFDLTVIDFIEFMETVKLRSIRLSGKTYQDRYIELISGLFNRYMELYSDKYDGMRFNLPRYLRHPEFQINTGFLHNRETINLISSSTVNQEVFKIFLAFYRKKRKRTSRLLTQGILRMQNQQYDRIQDYIEEGITDDVFSLKEWASAFDNDSLIIESQEIDLPSTPIPMETGIGAMQIVALCQRIFTGYSSSVNRSTRGKKKVNVLVGRFQPFHNGHAEICVEIEASTKIPVVLAQVIDGKVTGNRPLSKEVSIRMMESLTEGNPKRIGFVQVSSYEVSSIVEELRRNGFEPVTITVSDEVSPVIRKSFDFDNRKNQLRLLPDFKIMEYKRGGSVDKEVHGRDVREAIRTGNYSKFKSFIPKDLWPYYDVFRDHMKSKN